MICGHHIFSWKMQWTMRASSIFLWNGNCLRLIGIYWCPLTIWIWSVRFEGKWLWEVMGSSTVLKSIVRTTHGRFYSWMIYGLNNTQQSLRFPLLATIWHNIEYFFPGSSWHQWDETVKRNNSHHYIWSQQLICENSDDPKFWYNSIITRVTLEERSGI